MGVTAHALGHTYASLAISSGVNVLVFKGQFGHNSAAIKLDVNADLFDADPDAAEQASDKARAQHGPEAG